MLTSFSCSSFSLKQGRTSFIGKIPFTLCFLCTSGFNAQAASDKTQHLSYDDEIQVMGHYQKTRYTLNIDDYQKKGVQSILEVVKRIPGINIIHNGGPGQPASLTYRGFQQKQILVLLDGMPLNSIYTGSVDWAGISLAGLERVEFSPTGAGIEYGGLAMGGVLQLISKTPNNTSVRLASGSDAYRSIDLATGLQLQEQWSLSLQGRHQASSGTDALSNKDASGKNKAELHQDRDGYETNSFHIQSQFQLNPQLSGHVSHQRYLASSEFDSAFSAQPGSYYSVARGHSQQAQLTHSSKLTTDVQQEAHFSIGQTDHLLDNYSGNQHQQYAFRQQQARITETFLWQDQYEVTFGLDASQLSTEKHSNNFPKTTTHREGRFIKIERLPLYEDQWHQRIGLIAGLRWDQDSAYGEQRSDLMQLSYHPTSNHEVRVSREYSYRTPSFNELYYPGANPELQPEKALKHQAQWLTQWKQWHFDVSLFHNKMQDLIEGWPPKNTQNAESQGIDVALSVQWGRLWTALNMQLQRAYNQKTHDDLLATPHRTWQLEHQWKDQFSTYEYQFGQSTRWVSDQYDYGQKRLAGYSTTDLFAGLSYLEHRINVRLDNAFARSYITKVGYPMPGRTWLLTYQYAF